MGFAIPSKLIQSISSQLRNNGKILRPYLGIQFQTPGLAAQQANNLAIGDGALIISVLPNTPASATGLQQGDIITAVDHEKITESNQLDTEVSKFPAGTNLLVTWLRNGQQMDAPLILGVMK